MSRSGGGTAIATAGQKEPRGLNHIIHKTEGPRVWPELKKLVTGLKSVLYFLIKFKSGFCERMH